MALICPFPKQSKAKVSTYDLGLQEFADIFAGSNNTAPIVLFFDLWIGFPYTVTDTQSICTSDNGDYEDITARDLLIALITRIPEAVVERIKRNIRRALVDRLCACVLPPPPPNPTPTGDPTTECDVPEPIPDCESPYERITFGYCALTVSGVETCLNNPPLQGVVVGAVGCYIQFIPGLFDCGLGIFAIDERSYLVGVGADGNVVGATLIYSKRDGCNGVNLFDIKYKVRFSVPGFDPFDYQYQPGDCGYVYISPCSESPPPPPPSPPVEPLPPDTFDFCATFPSICNPCDECPPPEECPPDGIPIVPTTLVLSLVNSCSGSLTTTNHTFKIKSEGADA